jgi:hypothetical protein
MSNDHPVHALKSHLEAARLTAVQALAANESAVSPNDLKDLALIQAALVAVREEIAAHGGKLGWGTSDTGLD